MAVANGAYHCLCLRRTLRMRPCLPCWRVDLTRRQGMLSCTLSVDPFAGTALLESGNLAALSVVSSMQSGQTEARDSCKADDPGNASEMLSQLLNVYGRECSRLHRQTWQQKFCTCRPSVPSPRCVDYSSGSCCT